MYVHISNGFLIVALLNRICIALSFLLAAETVWLVFFIKNGDYQLENEI